MAGDGRVWRFGPFLLNETEGALRRSGVPVSLRPRTLAVLQHLLANPGRLVSREELIDSVWKDTIVCESNLTTCIAELRAALGDRRDPPLYIATAHRRGYRFVARVSDDVRESQQSPDGAPADCIVGRQVELAELENLWRRALDGKRQLVFIAGEPGIGKTALVDCFFRQLREGMACGASPDVAVARGLCYAGSGTGEPFGPVLDLLCDLDHENAEVLTPTLQERAAAWLPWLGDSGATASCGRTPTVPALTNERMARTLVDALDAMSHRLPLALLIEDLQWSDPSTLDLLSAFARRGGAARALFIATTRPVGSLPSGSPLRKTYADLRAHDLCHEVTLGRLSREAVAALLALRCEASPAELLVDAIFERSEGLPLFIHVLLEHLLDNRMLVRTGEACGLRISGKPLDELVPDTLRALVGAQIDAQVELHGPNVIGMLRAASVIGVEFSAQELALVMGLDCEEAELKCSEMASQGSLIGWKGTREWPNGSVGALYEFSHSLFRDVIYEQIPHRLRCQMHHQLADGLREAFQARSDRIAASLAHHYFHAGEWLGAAEHHASAGRAAVRKEAHAEALFHFESALQALDLAGTASARDRAAALEFGRAVSLLTLKGVTAPEVATALRNVVAHCGQTEPILAQRALMGLTAHHVMRGEIAEALNVSAEAQQMLALSSIPVSLAPAFRLYECQALVYAGELLRAELLGREVQASLDVHTTPFGEAEGAPAQWTDPRVIIRMTRAAIGVLRGSEDGLRLLNESVRLAIEADHRHTLAYAYVWTAVINGILRHWNIVREAAEKALKIAEDGAFALWRMFARFNCGLARARSGDLEAGVAWMEESLSWLESVGFRGDLPLVLTMVAETCLDAGRIDDADLYATRARQIADRHVAAPLTLRVLADISAARRERESAESYLRDAVAVAQGQGSRFLELSALIRMAELHAGAARQEARLRIQALLEECTDRSSSEYERARAVLADGAASRGTLMR